MIKGDLNSKIIFWYVKLHLYFCVNYRQLFLAYLELIRRLTVCVQLGVLAQRLILYSNPGFQSACFWVRLLFVPRFRIYLMECYLLSGYCAYFGSPSTLASSLCQMLLSANSIFGHLFLQGSLSVWSAHSYKLRDLLLTVVKLVVQFLHSSVEVWL